MKVVDDLVCVGPGIWRNHLELKKKNKLSKWPRFLFVAFEPKGKERKKKPRNKYK
jgi:hypothetical protein